MLFGANNERGLVMDGWQIKSVIIGQDGYTINDILVHDATMKDNTLHMKLGLMSPENGLPLALGVIRDVEAPAYDQEVANQIKEVQAKKPERKLRDYLMKQDIWEVK
jgi:2-oxoglutarate ferredoxin oxidoreductase subunit beta